METIYRFWTPKMTIRYFVLGLILSATISIAFDINAGKKQDAYKFMQEVCDATKDGKNQDGPCVKKLEKLILENNHKLSAKAEAETAKAHKGQRLDYELPTYINKFETFKEMAQLCTGDLASAGTKFQRICSYVRQGGDGGYTDWIYMEAVSCVLGYNREVEMIDPQMIGSFRKSFQECRKRSG